MYSGYAGQKDDSCNGLDGVGQQDFIMLLKTVHNVKFMNYF